MMDEEITPEEYLRNLKHILGPLIGGFDRYVESGIEPGSFLRAVLENDLMNAVARADMFNVRKLDKICEYMKFYMPYDCWGNKEKVERWLAEKKIERIKNYEQTKTQEI